MMRNPRTGYAVRLLAGLAVLVGLMLTGGLSTDSRPAFAAQPPAPPPGTIYYRYGSSLFKSMKANGTGVADALPSAAVAALTPGGTVPVAIPCNHLHGGERWFLTTKQTGIYDTVYFANGSTDTDVPHYDLVAVRKRPNAPTQLDVVQLTDWYGILVTIDWEGNWSNDANEGLTSFVAATVRDIRDTFVDDGGETSYVHDSEYKTLRLPVTATEIVAGDFGPFDDTLTDDEIDDLLGPSISTFSFNDQGTTSPAGNLSVAADSGLIIVDAAAPDYDNPLQVLWDNNAPPSPGIVWNPPQWSPNGLTIAFTTVPSGNSDGDVWTVPVSLGSAPAPKKVLGVTSVTKKGVTTTTKYMMPIWSPDSQYLVSVRNVYTGTTLTGTRLVRVPAAGGTPVDLGAVYPSNGFWGSYAIRWVSDN